MYFDELVLILMNSNFKVTVAHFLFYSLIFMIPGLNGILEAYQNSLQKVRLYGPTNFSPVIRHVGKFAEAESQSGVAKVGGI